MASEQIPSPMVLCTEHETLPAASEHMPLPVCDNFELTTALLEQMPSPSCNGFELLPVGAGTDAVTSSA